jgi:hypothetical protein
MPLELFGVGVAGRHHRGGFGYATIRLPRADAVSFRQASPLMAAYLSSVGKVMAFGCTVVSTVIVRLKHQDLAISNQRSNRITTPNKPLSRRSRTIFSAIQRKAPAATIRRS